MPRSKRQLQCHTCGTLIKLNTTHCPVCLPATFHPSLKLLSWNGWRIRRQFGSLLLFKHFTYTDDEIQFDIDNLHWSINHGVNGRGVVPLMDELYKQSPAVLDAVVL